MNNEQLSGVSRTGPSYPPMPQPLLNALDGSAAIPPEYQSTAELLQCYLEWNGIIGYTSEILRIVRWADGRKHHGA